MKGQTDLVPGTIHVGVGHEFQIIQEAIDIAPPGSTIVIHEGEYHESLIVWKSLTIMTPPGEEAVVTGDPDPGDGPGGYAAVDVKSSYTTLQGTSYSYGGTSWNDAAVKISYGSYIVVRNCNMYNSKQGVWVHGGDTSTNLYVDYISIYSNNIYDISGHGIYIQRTRANVHSNTIYRCGEGIMIAHGYEGSWGGIFSNTIHNCTTGLEVNDDYAYNYHDNTFVDCDFGESLYRGTSFTSSDNTFRRCKNGSAMDSNNNHIKTLLRNKYYSCDWGINTEGGVIDILDCEIFNSKGFAVVTKSDMKIDPILVRGDGGLRIEHTTATELYNMDMNTSGICLEMSAGSAGTAHLHDSRLVSRSDKGVFMSESSGWWDISNVDMRSTLGDGVSIINSSRVAMDNVMIKSSSGSITFTDVGAVSLKDLDIESTEGHGIFVDTFTGLDLVSCNISSFDFSLKTSGAGDISLSEVNLTSYDNEGVNITGADLVNGVNVTVDSNLSGALVVDSGSVDLSSVHINSINERGLSIGAINDVSVTDAVSVSNLTSIQVDASGEIVIVNISASSLNGKGIILGLASDLKMTDFDVIGGMIGAELQNGGISNGTVSDGIILLNSDSLKLDRIDLTGSAVNGVFLAQSTNITCYDLDIGSGYGDGIGFSWTDPSELVHVIPVNNTFAGRPIYYSYQESSSALTLDNYGEVIIVEGSDLDLKVTNSTPGGCYIYGSSGIDITGSNMTSGLFLRNSDGVTGENVDIQRHNDRMNYLVVDNSIIELYNSTIHKVALPGDTITAVNGGKVDLYSFDIKEPVLTDADPGTRITFHYLVGLRVLFSGGIDPVPTADYEVRVDDAQEFSTSRFGGSDPVTDLAGEAGPWWIPFQTIDSTGVANHTCEITVNVTSDLSWQKKVLVNSSFDQIVLFITDDIRVPEIPLNLSGGHIEDGDGIWLNWTMNQDDTELYRIYVKENDQWILLDELSFSNHSLFEIPNGTVMEFRVTSIDEVGLESMHSDEVSITALDMIAPLPARELEVIGYGGTNVSLNWLNSTSNDVEGYWVYLVDLNQTGGEVTIIEMIGDLKGLMFEYIELDPETPYSFVVVAYDEAHNPSLISNVVSINTPDITWPAISNVSHLIEEYKVTITWNTDQPTFSTLFIGESVDNFASYGSGGLSLEHEVILTDLLHDQTYYYYIFAEEPSLNSVTENYGGMFFSFSTPPFEGYLHVMVLDNETGKRIPAAIVNAVSSGVITNLSKSTEGDYGAILEPGNYTITVLADGYNGTNPVPITVSLLDWTNITIILGPVIEEEDEKPRDGGKGNWLLYLLLIIFAVIIIMIAMIFIIIKSRKKKEEEEGKRDLEGTENVKIGEGGGAVVGGSLSDDKGGVGIQQIEGTSLAPPGLPEASTPPPELPGAAPVGVDEGSTAPPELPGPSITPVVVDEGTTAQPGLPAATLTPAGVDDAPVPQVVTDTPSPPVVSEETPIPPAVEGGSTDVNGFMKAPPVHPGVQLDPAVSSDVEPGAPVPQVATDSAPAPSLVSEEAPVQPGVGTISLTQVGDDEKEKTSSLPSHEEQ
ncbi:MAG: right-handed parallel beta-helix repeat-containing protein [Candidatus Thermoplasmatota archaeon]|nr:right-handed parallel beta-helix repeat-containing protein [Candidatus Thermoplasmatota archaeon]